MAQITADFAYRMLEAYEKGNSTPLTPWEQAQLAWTWLKHHGHEVPERIRTPTSAGEKP